MCCDSLASLLPPVYTQYGYYAFATYTRGPAVNQSEVESLGGKSLLGEQLLHHLQIAAYEFFHLHNCGALE